MKTKFNGILTLLLALVVQLTFAQEKTISGTVVDETNMPLPGATVVIKGTATGTSTDFDGNYSIKANTGDVLVFSYVGYADQSTTIGTLSSINITLEPDTSLDEIIVLAYGKTSEAKNVAAITTISIESIEERANASVIQNLQGQIAGVNIGTGTGQPGADSTIILRGVGSINGNIEPLFILDGIPIDEDNFRSLNQNDIATFSVLKDAAATSIYGNRGANGAVVMTTKKGTYDGRLNFKYTSQYGFTELQDANIELMNSNQILSLQREYGVGRGNGLSDAEINAISGHANTYWTDVFFRKGTTMSHDFSMTSGSENSSNYTSFGFFEQDGIFIKSNLKRFNVRNNFNGKSKNDKFKYNLNLTGNFSKTNEIDNAGSGAIFFNPFSAALAGLPYLSPYNPDGSLTTDGGIEPGDIAAITANQNESVPYILLNSLAYNTDIEEEIKFLGSFNADYNFFDNFTAGIQLGSDFSSEKRLEILHPNSILGPFQVTGANDTEFGGRQDEGYRREFRLNTIAKLNYNNTFDEKHTVNATVFTEYYKAHLDIIGFNQFGLDPRLLGGGAAFIGADVTEDLDNDPTTPNTQPYIPTLSSFKAEEGLFSYFGTADYDYNGKYGVSGTVRRDASFRFVKDNAWGTFWSVAARWNIDKESFMSNSSFNLLKLRASHGTSGNQRILNAEFSALSLTRSLYSIGTGYNSTVSTALIGDPGNTDLKWEELTQTNIGIDFGVWKNRLSGSFDVYKKTTEDLFQNKPISNIYGTSNVSSNVGSMENKGIEGSLRYTVYNKNKWNIAVNANASYNKNEITELPASFEGVSHLGGSTALGTGESIGSFYLVEYAGVNPANGNPLFYDKNRNLTETISDDDRVFSDKSIYPTWQGGFGTKISYNGFSFDTAWSWVADIYRNNLDRASLEETSTIDDGRNRSVAVFNAWQNVGDITEVPRVGSTFNSVDYINSTDRYLEDASFLRLRNVSLGYSLPEKYLEKLPVTGVRLYVQGENLMTFSKYRGWDPESNYRTTDRGQYPTAEIYTLGASFNF